ncbi:MAG: ATP-binding protein [Gammaproteobacteria bacterium]|nr:ATP-binding protein [Gammaproteobacteria bacterium]
MDINYQNIFKSYLKNTSDLFLILSHEYCILDINPVAQKILGWEKKFVLNKKIFDLFEEGGLTPFFQSNVSTSQNTILCDVGSGNQKLKIAWTTFPIQEQKHGNSFLIVGEKKPALSDEKLQNLQLDIIMKYAPGLFYWKDLNSIYQGCNEEFAKLSGLKSRDDVVGKSDYDLHWENRAKEYIEIDQMVMHSGKADFNREEKVTHSKKTTMTALTNKVPLRNKEGQVIGVLGITTDITHQKEVERELNLSKEAAETANRVKTEFIANMSHDIRTPLTGVVGVSNILEELETDPELKQYARDVHECGEQLLSMLNNILDVVSADHIDDTDVAHEAFDLSKCLHDIIQLEKPTITLKKLNLIEQLDEDVPQYLISDRTKIHRILLNLVGNAIKFTPNGNITIETKLLSQTKKAARIYFAVSDTGIGILPSQRDKVFDRFFRATPSYKGLYKGHGVGLHIAQSYAKLLGSEIKLMSKEGQGTTFYFELLADIGQPENNKSSDIPLATTDLPQSEPIQSNTLGTQNTRNEYTLLLVEDNKIALKVLESIITHAGHHFKSAINGESALELAKTQLFDLIITDLGLPGISGQEFTRKLREWEKSHRQPRVPIIGLTAHTEQNVRKDCLLADMNDVITKPLTKPVLQRIVSQFLSHPEQQDFTEPTVPPISKLGADLPNFEEQLFALDQLAVLDADLAIKNLGGNKNLLISMLKELFEKELPIEKKQLEQAFVTKNWHKIEKLAHKMKGGLVYLGLIKLQHACQYLERYHKAGHQKLLEELYTQMMSNLEETKTKIHHWLKTEQESRNVNS